MNTNDAAHEKAKQSLCDRLGQILAKHELVADFVANTIATEMREKLLSVFNQVPKLRSYLDKATAISPEAIKKHIKDFIAEHKDSFESNNAGRKQVLTCADIQKALDILDEALGGANGRAKVVDLMLQDVMNDTGLGRMTRFYDVNVQVNALQRLTFLSRSLKGVDGTGTYLSNGKTLQCLADLGRLISGKGAPKMSTEEFLNKIREAESMLRAQASKLMLARTVRQEVANVTDSNPLGLLTSLPDAAHKSVSVVFDDAESRAVSHCLSDDVKKKRPMSGKYLPEMRKHHDRLLRMFEKFVLPGLVNSRLEACRLAMTGKGAGKSGDAGLMESFAKVMTPDRICEEAKDFLLCFEEYCEGCDRNENGKNADFNSPSLDIDEERVRDFTRYYMTQFGAMGLYDEKREEQLDQLESRTRTVELALTWKKGLGQKSLSLVETDFLVNLDERVGKLDSNQKWRKSDLQATDYSALVALKEGYVRSLVDSVVKKVSRQFAEASLRKRPDGKPEVDLEDTQALEEALKKQLENEVKAAVEKIDAVWKRIVSKQKEFVSSLVSKANGKIDLLVSHQVIDPSDKDGLLAEARAWAQGAYVRSIESFLRSLDPALSAKDIGKTNFDVSQAKKSEQAGIVAWLYEKILDDTDSRYNLVNELSCRGSLKDMANTSTNREAESAAGKLSNDPHSTELLDRETLRTSLQGRFKVLWNTVQSQVPLEEADGSEEEEEEKEEEEPNADDSAKGNSVDDDDAWSWIDSYMGSQANVNGADAKEGPKADGEAADEADEADKAVPGKELELNDAWLDKVDRKFQTRADQLVENYKQLEKTLVNGCLGKIQSALVARVKTTKEDVGADGLKVLEDRIFQTYAGSIKNLLRNWLERPDWATYTAEALQGMVFAAKIGGDMSLDDVVRDTIDRAKAEVRAEVKSSYLQRLVNGTALKKQFDFNAKSNLTDGEATRLGNEAVSLAFADAEARPLSFLASGDASLSDMLLKTASQRVEALAKSYRKDVDEVVGSAGRGAAAVVSGKTKGSYDAQIREYFSLKYFQWKSEARKSNSKPDEQKLTDIKSSCKEILRGMLNDFKTVKYNSIEEYLQTRKIQAELETVYTRTFGSVRDNILKKLNDMGVAVTVEQQKRVTELVHDRQSQHKGMFLGQANRIYQDTQKFGVNREQTLAKGFALHVKKCDEDYRTLSDSILSCVEKLDITADDRFKVSLEKYTEATRKNIPEGHPFRTKLKNWCGSGSKQSRNTNAYGQALLNLLSCVPVAPGGSDPKKIVDDYKKKVVKPHEMIPAAIEWYHDQWEAFCQMVRNLVKGCAIKSNGVQKLNEIVGNFKEGLADALVSFESLESPYDVNFKNGDWLVGDKAIKVILNAFVVENPLQLDWTSRLDDTFATIANDLGLPKFTPGKSQVTTGKSQVTTREDACKIYTLYADLKDKIERFTLFCGQASVSGNQTWETVTKGVLDANAALESAITGAHTFIRGQDAIFAANKGITWLHETIQEEWGKYRFPQNFTPHETARVFMEVKREATQLWLDRLDRKKKDPNRYSDIKFDSENAEKSKTTGDAALRKAIKEHIDTYLKNRQNSSGTVSGRIARKGK